MESPRLIEAILAEGAMSSTYKYALLKAVIDYIIDAPTERDANGFHTIPAVYLARKFIEYYWPLWRNGISQAPGNGNLAINGYLQEFVRQASTMQLPFSLETPETVARLIPWLLTAETLPAPARKLLHDVRATVIEMPVQYVANVRGGRESFFTLHNKGLDLLLPFAEQIQWGKRAIRIGRGGCSYAALEQAEHCSLLIAHRVFEELAELRFWIRDVIIKHWAEKCEQYGGGQGVNYAEFAGAFELYRPDRASLQPYRELYRALGLTSCFYTGNEITEEQYELDHFLPFSRFPVNAYWNLVPTTRTLNGRKSDRLIQLTDHMRNDALRQHFTVCLQANSPLIERETGMAYRRYYRREPAAGGQRVEELRELVLHLYDNLAQTTAGELMTI